MTQYFNKLKKGLKGFAGEETGSMVVPFALWTPVFLGLILSSIELGTLTIRNTSLDRALDETVREVRIGAMADVSHTALKQSICDKAPVLSGCMDTLHLEMISIDLRDYAMPPSRADCMDLAEESTPNRNFDAGTETEIMYLRACYKYRPITPAGTISSSLAQDELGYSALVSSSAYVQEPS